VSASRVDRIVAFLELADELKSVDRRTTVGARQENPAEHSWHMALYALLLADELEQPVDVGRTIELCLVHDLVEIRAGDTYAFDEAGKAGQAEREQLAADELFGLLPDDVGARLRALWDEFEAGETREARFARAVDRMQALVQNLAADGVVWRRHGIRHEQVVERNAPGLELDPALRSAIEVLLARADALMGD
jgi:putative hydrolase of HD superfamily